MRKSIVFGCFLVTLAGCAATGTRSSTAALPVKLINAEIAKKCTFVGVTSGHVYNAFHYASTNISDARMKAAVEAESSGANSAILTATNVQSPGHDVTVNMDAYQCPE